MKRKRLLLIVLLFAFSLTNVTAQTKVSGLVLAAEDKTALFGVNVRLKNDQAIGTVTSYDGSYTIEVPHDTSLLVFSYTGFETKVLPAATCQESPVLLGNTIHEIDEVVIVGFGTSTRRKLTSSVESVNSDVYDGAAKATPLQALQGRMAGVQITQSSGVVGSAMNVRIRGQTSINASNQPLYVVDGIITDLSYGFEFVGPGTDKMIGVDPNDIASVEVLKDGAATAIYGSRGANGVILINTKQGQFNTKPRVALSYQTGISEPTVNPDVMSGSEYASAWNRAVDAAGGAPSEFYFEDPDAVPNTDWLDILTRTAMFHDAHVSVSGGSPGTNYYLGLGYRNEEDYFITKGMTRYSLRSAVNQLIGDDWQAGLKVNLSRTSRSRLWEGGSISQTPMIAGALFPPTTVPFDENGDPILSHQGPGYDFGWSPYVDFTETRPTNELSQVRLGLSAQYSPLPGLSLKTEFSPEFALFEMTAYASARVRLVQQVGGYRGLRKISELNNLWTNTATWTIPTSGRSELTLLLGNQLQWVHSEDLGGSVVGFADPDLTSLSSGGEFNNLYSETAAYKFSGFFARANFAHANKYFASASLRRDGSSRFGANDRWGVFPALSIGWLISEESFMDNSILDYLKVSASVGRTGNAEIGNFDSRSLLVFNSSYGSEPSSSIPERLGNNDLTWETTVQYNVSAEFAMLGDLLNGKLSWFLKNTDGLLFYLPVPSSTGFAEIPGNNGSVRNSGFEFELGASLQPTSALSLEFGFNGAYVKNEITALPDNDGDGQGDDIVSGSYIWRVGQNLSTNYLVRYAGVDPASGDALFYDVASGAPTTEYNQGNRLIAGRAIPSFTGGGYLDASYKGFFLSAIIQSALGFHVHNPQFALEDGFAFPPANNKNRRQLNSWTPDNTDTDIPEARAGEINGSQPGSTRWLEKGDYLRLKQVQLGYRFKNFGRNAQTLTVYLAGQNVWTASSGYNRDPEGSAAPPDQIFVGGGSYVSSTPRSFSLGIKLQL